MKDQLLNLKRFLQLVTMLSVVGVFSIAQAQNVVELRVSDNEDELEITTHGTCAGPDNSNGCVSVSGRVLINFNLTGQTDCSSGGNWELDRVVLSEEKGAAPGISADAASDFNADEGTGLVTPNAPQTPRHIQIRDNNEEKYDIWYTVYAKCAAGGLTIDADPRIKNDGTG